jgi:hypothetical protein
MKVLARKLIIGVALTGAALGIASNVSIFAHHGGGIEYKMDETAGPITGVATEFAFRFPHPQVYMDVKDKNGKVTRWAIVLRSNPISLRDRGWSRDSIKPGDTLTFMYSPHRTAATVGFARRVEINGKFFDEGM